MKQMERRGLTFPARSSSASSPPPDYEAELEHGKDSGKNTQSDDLALTRGQSRLREFFWFEGDKTDNAIR
jgi:hypothetical protein